MKVSDIAIKKVVTVEEDDSIAKVLSKMDEHRIHQVPVLKDGSVTGMVLLKHLLGRDYNAGKTLAKNFAIKASLLNPEMDLDTAISHITGSGLRALPVVEDDKIVGILSETDLIKHVEVVKDIEPDNLMSKAVTIVNEENLDKAMALMYDNSISRLPVVNNDGKLLGCVDSLSLINFLMEPKESPRYSSLTTKEKESLKQFKVKNYLRNTVQLDLDGFSLNKVIKLLQNNEEIVVTKNQKPVGVVVPKDVLELAGTEQRYPVFISHLSDADPFEVAKFKDMLTRFMEKFGKMFTIQKLYIYADTYKKKEEGHNKFSLRARFLTDKKVYLAKSHGWDLKEASHILLDNVEKQLIRNHEEHLGKSKRKIKG